MFKYIRMGMPIRGHPVIHASKGGGRTSSDKVHNPPIFYFFQCEPS